MSFNVDPDKKKLSAPLTTTIEKVEEAFPNLGDSDFLFDSKGGFPLWTQIEQDYRVITADRHQHNILYQFPGLQCVAMSATAVIFAHFESISDWNRDTMHNILHFGDKLYEESWRKIETDILSENLDAELPQPRYLYTNELEKNAKAGVHIVKLDYFPDPPLTGSRSDKVIEFVKFFLFISLSLLDLSLPALG